MNEARVGIWLRLKAGGVLLYATLRHPFKTSHIVIDMETSSVSIEYEESHYSDARSGQVATSVIGTRHRSAK